MATTSGMLFKIWEIQGLNRRYIYIKPYQREGNIARSFLNFNREQCVKSRFVPHVLDELAEHFLYRARQRYDVYIC